MNKLDIYPTKLVIHSEDVPAKFWDELTESLGLQNRDPDRIDLNIESVEY